MFRMHGTPWPTGRGATRKGGGRVAIDVYLLRHGQTPNNITGERIYDAGLTALGQAQAERLARALGDVGLSLVVASPLRRSLETARPLAAAAGVGLSVWNDLVEHNRWDPYTSLARDDLGRLFPEADIEPEMPPGGWMYPGPEPPTSVFARVRRLQGRIAALPAGTAVALVAHGTLNGMLLAAWLGLAPAAPVSFSQDNACISHLRLDMGAVQVVRCNDTAHLDGLRDRAN